MRDDNLTTRIKKIRQDLQAKKSTQPSGASNQIINLIKTNDAYDVSIMVPSFNTFLVHINFELSYNNANYAYTQAFAEPVGSTDPVRSVGAIDINIVTKKISFKDYIILDNITPDKLFFDYKFYVLCSTTGTISNIGWSSVTI